MALPDGACDKASRLTIGGCEFPDGSFEGRNIAGQSCSLRHVTLYCRIDFKSKKILNICGPGGGALGREGRTSRCRKGVRKVGCMDLDGREGGWPSCN
jgi:hypothetical protein